ncbi:transcription regulator HTH, apses-type DNA-binding domain-containing protein, partial [Catenaria anguillulae PL171]
MDPPTPRPITTFTWDDMSTLVYQVDVDLIAVCRRAADNYVNGTKLLNLTAMSRGKRDSILKHERLRSVVKCGPMRLKGVWIPLDRARELARAVKVDAQVYPLLEEQVDAWV